MSFDEKTVTRIIQPVTTAVLISLAEGRKEAEEDWEVQQVCG